MASLISNALSGVLAGPSTVYNAIVKPIDALFNIPLLSVLLLPSLSSWSTSFNVLFFYATWSLLLLSQPPLAVEFLGTLLIRLVFFVVPSAAFLALDAALPFVMRNIKQHGEDGIATSASNGGAGLRRGRWWRVAAMSSFNLVLGVAVQTAVDWFLTTVLRTRSALVISTTLPMPWQIIKSLVAAYLLRELISYAVHRFLLHPEGGGGNDGDSHNGSSNGNRSRSRNRKTKNNNRISAPPFVQYLAKQHGDFYHHLHTPLPMSGHFDHPLAYLVRVWLPDYLPGALIRMHLLTYHLWLALVSVEQALVYSNYITLPTGLVLGGMARRAERHLLAGGRGNYSAYGLADLLAGSSLGDDDLIDDVVEEAQRRDLPERARNKGRQVRDVASDVANEIAPDGVEGAKKEIRRRVGRAGRAIRVRQG